MDKGVDTGDILEQIEIPITADETSSTLYKKVNTAHTDLIEKIIDYTYTYKFTNKKELETAIHDYPNNINIYGECKYWDVSTITDMSEMFGDSEFNEDIFNWDVSNVKNMYNMFCNL